MSLHCNFQLHYRFLVVRCVVLSVDSGRDYTPFQRTSEIRRRLFAYQGHGAIPARAWSWLIQPHRQFGDTQRMQTQLAR